jgi:O-antigen ligase
MRAIRFGICALLAFAVFAHGAVEAWSQAVLEAGAAVLFLLWGILQFTRRRVDLSWNPLGGPFIGFGAFALLQYLAHLTVYPYLTKIELLNLAAFLLLFFLAAQVFRTSKEWEGFVWFLLVLGFVVSTFGIIQHFTFNGKLYWLRELRYGGIPFGPYVNRNHFAGLVELLVPPGLALLILRGVRRDLLPLVALFTLLPIGALFLAASVAGISTFLVQVGLLAILIWTRRAEKEQVAAAAVVLLLAGVFVAWLGVGNALERFAWYKSQEVSQSRRLAMVRDSWHIFLEHQLLGTGLGTLVAVYPRYETVYDGKIVDHAHNDYVEALAETGVIGGLFCLTFVALLFRSGLANLRASHTPLDQALHVGALVACAGLLVHGLVDFNLHVPSNALLFFLQAALASSPPGPRT